MLNLVLLGFDSPFARGVAKVCVHSIVNKNPILHVLGFGVYILLRV